MNVSPRARGLVSTVMMAELKFSIESTDRRAFKAPNGSGIGSREIRWTVAKLPFSPSP